MVYVFITKDYRKSRKLMAELCAEMDCSVEIDDITYLPQIQEMFPRQTLTVVVWQKRKREPRKRVY